MFSFSTDRSKYPLELVQSLFLSDYFVHRSYVECYKYKKDGTRYKRPVYRLTNRIVKKHPLSRIFNG